MLQIWKLLLSQLRFYKSCLEVCFLSDIIILSLQLLLVVKVIHTVYLFLLKLLLLHLINELRLDFLLRLLSPWLLEVLIFHDFLFHVYLSKSEGALVAAACCCRGIRLSLRLMVLCRVSLIVAFDSIWREGVIWKHSGVALNIIYSILWRDTVLNVEFLLLTTKVVWLGS